jgi:hypothetical protein
MALPIAKCPFLHSINLMSKSKSLFCGISHIPFGLIQIQISSSAQIPFPTAVQIFKSYKLQAALIQKVCTVEYSQNGDHRSAKKCHFLLFFIKQNLSGIKKGWIEPWELGKCHHHPNPKPRLHAMGKTTVVEHGNFWLKSLYLFFKWYFYPI